MASESIAFAGATVDRAPRERRQPEWLAARRAEPEARSLVVSERGLWVDEGHLLLVPPNGDAAFLGLAGGRHWRGAQARSSGRPARGRHGAAGGGGRAGRLRRVVALVASPASLLRQLRATDRV